MTMCTRPDTDRLLREAAVYYRQAEDIRAAGTRQAKNRSDDLRDRAVACEIAAVQLDLAPWEQSLREARREHVRFSTIPDPPPRPF